jgi:predicted dehydrogenase
VDREHNQQLRVGIIGLGPNWRRYRRALLANRDRFVIRALYDQVWQLAATEAHHLHCEAAEGPGDLLETSDLDAVLLLDHQWYGLWPLELAARQSKPVYCVPPLATDAEHAEAMCTQLEQAPTKILFERRLLCNPVTRRLQRLLRARLGPPHLLLCHAAASAAPQSRTQAGGPMDGDSRPTVEKVHRLSGLIDWCIALMNAPPIRVHATAMRLGPHGGLETWLLDFGGGRAAQINVTHQVTGTLPASPTQATILAERGTAQVTFPRRLGWSYRHTIAQVKVRSPRPAEFKLLRQFYQLATGGDAGEPQLQSARTVLRAWAAAQQSQAEGGPVAVPGAECKMPSSEP